MSTLHPSAVSRKIGSDHENIANLPQNHLYPRPSPPRDSVSLPANKRQKLSHSTQNPHVVHDKRSRASLKKESSQESGSSDRSASRWFDNVNKHVKQNDPEAMGYDEEPPFYMSTQNNYNPLTNPRSDSGKRFGANSRLDSENEDLRGVIDDLTVENKRLKHVLRTQRDSRTSRSGSETQDKLFEVRMHQLSPEKRRELEFLLKNFATSVHTSTPTLSRQTSNSGVSSSSIPGKQIPTDSGYASNSNSGQASLAPSRTGQVIPALSRSSKDKNVKNYLYDIPDTIMPRQHPVVMSEHAKMALVVKRLEQLFTGKNASPTQHSQPQQQQEVSKSAARADAGSVRTRAIEGTREAHILPTDSQVNFEQLDRLPQKRSLIALKASDDSEVSNSEGNISLTSRPGSPDQRPTRPLDLDIHRAQVGAENIQYIRHLGLSSPRLEILGQPDETSWLYLNLLVNMAQLHTINVTPEFVRKAIKKHSNKLEVSRDGNRVRWSGGLKGTEFSTEEEKALEAIADANAKAVNMDEGVEDSGAGRSHERSKTGSASNAFTYNSTSEAKTSHLQTSGNPEHLLSTGATSMQQYSPIPAKMSTGTSFDYKPIVYRADKGREADNAYLQDSDSSLDNSSRDSSGLVHALSTSNMKDQRGSDEGLITYFANPYFCSDYSGDKLPSNMRRDRNLISGETVGMLASISEEDESPIRYGDACYFTPQFGPKPIYPHPNGKILNLHLDPLRSAGEDETLPMDFPASGIAGVCPDDNFAIDVKVGMVKTGSAPRRSMPKFPVANESASSHFRYEVLVRNKVQLLPSRLPPPSYMFFNSGSSSGNQEEDDMEEESDDSSSSADSDHLAPPTFSRRWTGEQEIDGNDSDDEDMKSSSVDMLAAARAADPERIAEEERQYIIGVPGGCTVAGSLAATVGASRSSSSSYDIDSDASACGSQMDTDDEE